MTRRATPAQSETLAKLFAGEDCPRNDVISTRQGWDGKNIICHRILAPDDLQMFRIFPDGRRQAV